MDSLEEICGIIGLEFSDYKETKKLNPDLEIARKILHKAVQIYQKVSHDSTVFNQFLNNRRITAQTAKIFKLGFAPSNNILANYLLSIKDSKERDHALRIGISLKIIHHDKVKKGNYFDSFRDRIMFHF